MAHPTIAFNATIGVKILVLDLETTPLEAYSWGPKWETNLIEVTQQSRVLSFSAKWVGGKHITKGWPDYKGYRKGVLNDKKIVKDIWKLLDEADVVVGQNSNSFDLKILNTRFLFHGLTPPSPYKKVDTKLEAKKYLRMPSNGLDDIGGYFHIGRKVEHEGFPLWKRCMAGDKKAWKKMLRYNKHDVILTEKFYLLLRPWMDSHPNAGMYKNKAACSRCGSGDVVARGYSVNKTTRYQRMQCKQCGSWMRAPGNISEIKPLVSI